VIQKAKNAMASWRYCGKEETRLEGPLECGLPAASKAVKGDTKERNSMILEFGAVDAVKQGLVPVDKFKQLKQSLDLFAVMDRKPVTLNGPLQNEWHYGPTGTGKSYQARKRYPNAFIKSNDVWWDGYQNEETVIIEEMGPKQIGGHHMKIWCDRYPFKASQKGSQLFIRPKRIVVTSNYSIREVFGEDQDIDPLLRRFEGNVIHHTIPYVYEENN